MEGLDSGSVDVGPSPYNVVLEDDTYEGEIVVGFKFSVKVNATDRGSGTPLSAVGNLLVIQETRFCIVFAGGRAYGGGEEEGSG